jgi:L-lactate dehydrogenase (cytochrome)
MKDRKFIESLINRAKAANCSALVLTLDLQIQGQRHKDLKNGLTAPPKLTVKNVLNMMTKPSGASACSPRNVMRSGTSSVTLRMWRT